MEFFGQYAQTWDSYLKILEYVRDNFNTLSSKTINLMNNLYNSSLPPNLIELAANKLSVLKSPTCMYMADGNFYGFEGCGRTSGLF